MTKNISIMFLLTQDLESPSGLGRYWPWSKALAKIGHPVEIFALHSDYSTLDQPELEKEGVRIQYVAQMHVLKNKEQKKYFPVHRLVMVSMKATLALIRASQNSKADLVIVGKPHPMNGLAGILMKVFKGKKLWVDCDDYEAASSNFSGRWQKWGVAFFENLVPRLADHLSTNTIFSRDRLATLGISPERITYLPNGVDRDRFIPPEPSHLTDLREELGIGQNKIVSFIGSLSLSSHPVDLLVRAFKKVREVIPQSLLLLVGGGESRGALERLVSDQGLENAVSFCGRIPPEKAPLYYGISDVVVDPVYDDDAARGRSPLKMFESWAVGTPFVTGKVGDRILLAGSPPVSLLVDPGRPQALAEGIIEVLSNPAAVRKMRAGSRQKIELYYWDRLIDTLRPGLHSLFEKPTHVQPT